MAAMSGCPPTEISCDPNAPLQAVSSPATPTGLVTIVEVAVGCVIALLLVAGVYLLLTRRSAIPLWRRRLAMGALIFALISAAVAVYVWGVYQSFAQIGLPINASYTAWLTQIGPVKMGDLDTMLNEFTFITAGLVLVSLVLAVLVIEQAMRQRVRRNTL